MVRSAPLQIVTKTDPHSEMRKRRWERRFLRETGLPSMDAYVVAAKAEIDRQLAAQ